MESVAGRKKKAESIKEAKFTVSTFPSNVSRRLLSSPIFHEDKDDRKTPAILSVISISVNIARVFLKVKVILTPRGGEVEEEKICKSKELFE